MWKGEKDGKKEREERDKEEEGKKKEANPRYRRNEDSFRPRRTNIHNNP
jgi:hypothetical protein